MKNISIDAGLSMLYTNHSIRATCITVLDKAGNEARHIMSVSGHKNESSIRSYSQTDITMKRKMSDMLSSTIIIPPKKSANIELINDDLDVLDITDQELWDIDFKINCNQGNLRERSSVRNFKFGLPLSEDTQIGNVKELKEINIDGTVEIPSYCDEKPASQVICDNLSLIFVHNAVNTSFNNCVFNLNNK